MIEEVEQERQTVGSIDVLEHADIAGRRAYLLTEIVDKGIVIFKDGRPVESDQTLFRFDHRELFIGRQGKISGDRTDHQKVVLLHRFQQGQVFGCTGDDADQFSRRQDLLLEEPAGMGGILRCQDHDTVCFSLHDAFENESEGCFQAESQ